MRFLTKLNVLILLLSLGFSSSLLASNTIPPESKPVEYEINKDAGLYYFQITVDDAIKPSESFLGMKVYDVMPDDKKESLMNMVMARCAKKFKADVEAIYYVNKKGKVIKGLSETGFYFPSFSYKNAVKNYKHDLFIYIDVRIANNGKALKVGRKKSKITPNATGSITVYDRNKEKVYKNNVNLKSLEGIITLTNVKEGISIDHTVSITEKIIADLLMD